MNKIIPLIGIAAALGVSASPALADSHNRSEAAMTKGIRDYAKYVADGAKVSHVSVDAGKVDDVGDKTRVVGSFQLTKGGKTVTYKLTSKARVLRISPGAIEYKLSAQASNPASGLPKSTGSFTGFLQGPAAREA
jgi:hypothetical protein